MTDVSNDTILALTEGIFLEFVRAEELPAEGMRTAVECWDICGPFFVGILEHYAEDELDPTLDGDAPLFLVHLFGQMRETRAYRPLTKFLARPIETLRAALGDTIAETLPRILTGVFDGDPDPLEGLFLNADADEFIQWAALSAYAGLVRLGRIEVGRAERVLLAASTTVLVPDSAAWIGWQRACAAIGTPALIDHARARVAADDADTIDLNAAEFEQEIAAWATDPAAKLEDVLPLADALAELSRWHGFSEAGVAERRKADTLGGSIGHETVVNAYRKVGRNDPCPFLLLYLNVILCYV